MSVADFWRFYSAVVQRKWVVLATVLGTMSVVAIGCLLLPRYYRASALVMPSEEALRRPMIAGAAATAAPAPVGSPERDEHLANLVFLATSQTVLGRALAPLNLRLTPEQAQRLVTVESLPRTSLLKITVLWGDPDHAIRLTNSVAQTFTRFYEELSHREAINNRRFLQEQLDDAEAKLHKAEADLTLFSGEAGGARAAAGPHDDVSPYETERDSAAAQLRESEARLRAVKARLVRESSTIVSEQGTTDNPVVTQLRSDLARMENELAAELAIHTELHPTVRSLRARIDDAQKRLNKELRTVVRTTTVARNPLYDNLVQAQANLEADKAAFAAKLGAMDAALGRRQGQARTASSQAVQLAALNREYRIAEETYSRLHAAVEQARVDEKVTSDAGALRIVDLATRAEGPVTKGPTPVQLLALGLVLSLALGLGLAIGLDLLDSRLKTTEDVRRLLELPVTGVIPAMAGRARKALPRMMDLEPGSAYAEAYRFLRTDLLFTAQERPIQTVMVATAKPGQGGTTTIANLAIATAEADKRVILVDADLRRPSLHEIFNLPNDVGLSTVLADGVELGEALRPTSVDNLLLLTGGPTPRNASALIASQRMRDLVQQLRQHCDFVFFDTPSAAAFSDAAVLSQLMDGVLLVVRAQESPRGTELQIKQLLNKAKAHIIGVVLNDVDPEKVDSYHFHSHYYRPQPAPGQGEAPAALPGAEAEDALPPAPYPETSAAQE